MVQWLNILENTSNMFEIEREVKNSKKAFITEQ